MPLHVRPQQRPLSILRKQLAEGRLGSSSAKFSLPRRDDRHYLHGKDSQSGKELL